MNGDPFSKEAKSYNSQLVAGKTVMMIKDQSEVDRFDRLLRYVIVGNTFVNYDLVEKGAAYAKDYPPDSACSPTLSGAQDSAKLFDLGLWALAAAPLLDTSRSGVVEDPRAGCDPSYPDVCIPPPPPDLDCGDISFRKVQGLTRGSASIRWQ